MKFLLALFVVLVSNASGQDIKWNVWDTPNFEVWSVDRSQGEYVNANIESMRDWIYTHWGLKSTNFPVHCKIWVTPNKELMNTLFHLTDGAFAKVERDPSGKVIKADIFVLWDKKVSDTILPALTIVCLAEKDIPFPFWVKRGMVGLNLSVPQIRLNIGFKPNEVYPLKTMFAVTEQQWTAMPIETRRLFDLEATDFCLMLRKEYGQDICLQVMRTNDTRIMGFSTPDAEMRTLKRYMKYVAEDIQSKRMPDSYLTIKKKEN